jgi:hypothetical protein
MMDKLTKGIGYVVAISIVVSIGILILKWLWMFILG